MAENPEGKTTDSGAAAAGTTSQTTTSDPCGNCKPCIKCDADCPCKKPDPKPECFCLNCDAACGCPRNPKTLPDLPPPQNDCPSKCKCPNEGSGTTSQCLDDIVAKQEGNAGAAERDKLKAELTKIVETTKKARQAYTREKYEDLKKKWGVQDGEIVKLLHKFKCSVSCWPCVIECHINPLLKELNRAEHALYDDGKLIKEINDLYDKQYFVKRYRDNKARTSERILNVIKAWDSPAASIEKTINENDKLIDDISKQLGLQPGKVIYDLFIVLIPRHLAITPRPETSKIATECKDVYQEIDKDRDKGYCNYGAGAKDDCCGVNTAQLGFLERLVSPRAYLIDPDKYFDLICCLIKCRYERVANIVIDANIELEKINGEIERNLKIIGPGWPAEFEKNARAAIPSEIDCKKYPPKKVDQPAGGGDCGDGAAKAEDVRDEGDGNQDRN